MGSGNPCDDTDMDLFCAVTSITLGDGRKASFWHSPWLEGQKSKDIAPTIFSISKKRGMCVRDATRDRAWVSHINVQHGLSTQHSQDFLKLWTLLSDVHLYDRIDDDISWNLSNSGVYSTMSTYKVQFAGLISTSMNPVVWRNWPPPKCKFFAWLVLNNRVWTADRLEKRGWLNCGICQLCKREPEIAAHILFSCKFSIRIWLMVRDWLGLAELNPSSWQDINSVREWWDSNILGVGMRSKAIASIAMLVIWELWNERNARAFRNISTMPLIIFYKIKNETRNWMLAGAKHLSSIMPGE